MKSLNELATSIFVEELSRQGIQDVFIAPGSRSSPLVIACANNPKVKIHTHFDERGLGFFALGWSKSSKKPSVVITTSGTAVANLLPAIVEAHYSYTPMIICSADRPPELINVGANQAITQRDIFSNFVSEYMEIQPVDTQTSLESILTSASHLAMMAQDKSQPIHVNWMFREPLAPISATGLREMQVETPQVIHDWLQSEKPYVQYAPSKPRRDVDTSLFDKFQKTLLVFGSMIDESESESLLKIAEDFDAPVFCDVQNPLRFKNFKQNILRFDLLLDATDIEVPDTIIHLGGPLTSKALNKFIERSSSQYVHIHDKPTRLDFMHKSKLQIQASASDIASSITKQYKQSQSYLEKLQQLSERIANACSEEFKETLNELSVPYHLVENLHATNLFIGSSMPIRDLEKFAGTTDSFQAIFNRGASGIDGNIATAVGAAIKADKDFVCVLGDQAFLYDMNSLALVKSCTKTFHTVVLNNQGGGIFSFLPIANIEGSTVNKYFTHPHEWSIQSAAETFHLNYVLAKTPSDFIKAIQSKTPSVIEVRSNISENVKVHRDFTKKLKSLYE